MNVLELRLRTESAQGQALVKLRVSGAVDADGYVEITCVETISDEGKQTIVLSDEKGK